eukprot:121887_1
MSVVTSDYKSMNTDGPEAGLIDENDMSHRPIKSNKRKWIAILVSLLIITVIAGCVLITYLFVFNNPWKSSSESESYDFIVIGSGPSGSIVSSRLASHGYSVLLLEAGNATQVSLNGTLSVTQSTDLTLFDIPLDWDTLITNASYTTPPNSGTYSPSKTDATHILPVCGRGVGGSGSINAMIYIRGTHGDFTTQHGWIDEWTNYTKLLQYYMKSEQNTNIFDSPYHNNSGNVHISYNFDYETNTLSNAFLAACRDKSYLITDDFNAPNRGINVCGHYQFLISDAKSAQALRYSVARAFYGNDVRPSTLTIKANAMAIDIIFDEYNRTRATGVRYVELNHGNKLRTAYATKEIIVSAGTLNTPSILMQSGVGDADVLMQKFDFKQEDIVVDNKYVGKHYLDGVFTYVQWNVSSELIDNFTLCTPWNSTFGAESDRIRCASYWNKYVNGNQNHTVFDTTGFYVGGFFKSPYSVETIANDLQITLQPFDILYQFNQTNIMTAQIANNLPFSQGYLTWNYLNRVKDLDGIVVDGSNIEVIGNYLAEETDVDALVFGINLTRKLFGSQMIDKYIIEELFPGRAVKSHTALREFVIANRQSADHIVGTSKMGYVVDKDLKVIGLQNVRIADASVMPSLPSGNTHATCMMIGEFAAALIIDHNK